jgi:hypothetical protein
MLTSLNACSLCLQRFGVKRVSRILFLLAAAVGSAACSPCKCANSFCVYALDGGGCGYSNANCSNGTPMCFTAMGALGGPVADAGPSCVYTPAEDPVCSP